MDPSNCQRMIFIQDKVEFSHNHMIGTIMFIDVEAALIHIITWFEPRVANPWCQGYFVIA